MLYMKLCSISLEIFHLIRFESKNMFSVLASIVHFEDSFRSFDFTRRYPSHLYIQKDL